MTPPDRDEHGRSGANGYPAVHSARVWLDEDGRHVWLSHDCNPPHEEIIVSMLPSTWTADDAGNVTPSIHCTRCGLHYFARIGDERA